MPIPLWSSYNTADDSLASFTFTIKFGLLYMSPPAISTVFPINRILHSISMRSILNIKTRLTFYTPSNSNAKAYSISLSFSSLNVFYIVLFRCLLHDVIELLLFSKSVKVALKLSICAGAQCYLRTKNALTYLGWG